MDILAHFRKYLTADDVDAEPITAPIEKVEFEQISGEEKPVLYLAGVEKGVVLNVTNSNRLAALYGGDTDMWTGKPVTLHTEPTQMKGRPCKGLRVKM